MSSRSPISLCAAAAMVAALTASAILAAQGADQPQPAGPRQPNPAYAKVVDDPKLPRVLLIGDSISIGYTVPVRELLSGQANVHRIPANGGPTTNGLKNLDAWLGDGKWDVIHFNWGLHDIKYVDDKSALTTPENGRQQVPAQQYEANLRELVKRLKKTGAKLIWCATTPVPEGANGRVAGDEVKYNAIAARVMAEEQVPINDLYAFAQPQLEKIQLRANVHFTPDGSRVLAAQVVQSIRAALAR